MYQLNMRQINLMHCIYYYLPEANHCPEGSVLIVLITSVCPLNVIDKADGNGCKSRILGSSGSKASGSM